MSTTLTVERLDSTSRPVSAACSAAHADGRVADLAHHDHVGVLAERVHQRRLRARRVGSHLALVDHRSLVGVQHLDRVFDRDDVTFPRAVHVVDHRGERRGLPGAGETGDEHEPVRLVGERGDGGRHRQRVEAGDAGQHATEHESHPTALAERADAEAAEPGDAVHEVGLVRAAELDGARLGHDRERAPLDLGRLDGVEGRLAEHAVDAQARARSHLDVRVRSALLDGEPQQAIEIQHAHRGIDSSARLL